MKLSDEICESSGVHTLQKPTFNKDGQNDVLGDKEYRSAVRGESFKFALMNAITDCMKQAKSKKQFVKLMNRKGYDVRWEQQRKYITYTTPKGKKCRCNKLHDRRFTKEMMEYEFKIRYAIFNGTEQGAAERGSRDITNGGSAGTELDSGAESVEFDMSVAGRAERKARQAADRRGSERFPEETAGTVRAPQTGEPAGTGTDTDDDAKHEKRTAQTGWESERRILISAERARELAAESKLKAVQGADSITSAAIDTVGDIAALVTLIEDSDEDEDEYYSHADSKLLKQEREKKESLGMYMG